MRLATPPVTSDVATAFSRAGHFVSGMFVADLFAWRCVGDAPVRCADPVRTMFGADARPWKARGLAAWMFAEPSDSAVQMAIATLSDSI